MICRLCRKSNCPHIGPDDEQHASPGPATTVVERKPRSGDSLFELVGLRDLECVLCKWVAPPGRYQPVLRIQHGLVHVRDGTAVEIRRGLPEGAVRYEVV